VEALVSPLAEPVAAQLFPMIFANSLGL